MSDIVGRADNEEADCDLEQQTVLSHLRIRLRSMNVRHILLYMDPGLALAFAFDSIATVRRQASLDRLDHPRSHRRSQRLVLRIDCWRNCPTLAEESQYHANCWLALSGWRTEKYVVGSG